MINSNWSMYDSYTYIKTSNVVSLLIYAFIEYTLIKEKVTKMRNVFIQQLPMQKLSTQIPISDDYDIDGNFSLPLGYIINNVTKEDSTDVLVISSGPIPLENSNAHALMLDIYTKFKVEISALLSERNINVRFVEIWQSQNLEVNSFSAHFKALSSIIEHGDQLYLDLTWGRKPYTMAEFMSVCYAARAAVECNIEEILYQQFFDGTDIHCPKIYRMNELHTLWNLISTLHPGDKNQMDYMFSIFDEN